MMTTPFRLHTETYSAVGISRRMGDILREKGLCRAVVLVDEGVAQHSPYFTDVRRHLEERLDYLSVLTLRGTEEPDYDYLDEVANHVREVPSMDILIGIGGGSCLDVTKAAAILRTNPGAGIEYRGFDRVTIPGIPTVAIPTTAGTGSEATINAVFTDKREMKKLGINGRFMNATYAVLDAEWTMSCPRPVAISSGMDALVHCLESFMCQQHTAITRAFSREAFRLLYHHLPALVDDPDNLSRRQALLLGSYFAGIALFNSGSGIAGALSYPLGVHYKIPHGIAGGVFIASVVQYNIDRGYDQFSELLDLIECKNTWSHKEKNEDFARKISALADRLGVPKYLDHWGITEAHIENVCRLMLPFQAAFNQNPVPFSAESDAPVMLKKHILHR